MSDRRPQVIAEDTMLLMMEPRAEGLELDFIHFAIHQTKHMRLLFITVPRSG